jgi:hypothetical protein
MAMRVIGIFGAAFALLLSALLLNPETTWLNSVSGSADDGLARVLFVVMGFSGIISAGLAWWFAKSFVPLARAFLVTFFMAAGFAPGIVGGHGLSAFPLLIVIIHFREQGAFWWYVIPFLLIWIGLLVAATLLRFAFRRAIRDENAV